MVVVVVVIVVVVVVAVVVVVVIVVVVVGVVVVALVVMHLAVQGKNNIRGPSLCLQLLCGRDLGTTLQHAGPQSLFAERTSSCCGEVSGQLVDIILLRGGS